MPEPLNISKLQEAINDAVASGVKRLPDYKSGYGWEFEPKSVSEQAIKANYLKESGWEIAKAQGFYLFKSPHTGEWSTIELAVIEQNEVERKQRSAANAMTDAAKKVSANVDPKAAAAIKLLITAMGITDETKSKEIEDFVIARIM